MQGMQQQPQIEHGIGSGVIISPDGYIVTNNHVVDGATQIRVTLNDRRIFTAKVIGTDKLNDLAVIKIDAHDLPSIPWGDSTKLHPGQTVLAFGSPFGYFQFSVTRGIVSALNRPNPYTDDRAQTGRLHSDRRSDQSGQLGRTAGGCARRADRHQHLHHFQQRLVCGRRLCDSVADCAQRHRALIKTGTVHHGYLGISMNDVTPDNSSFFNLPDATGAIVSQVTPDSPASRAGLKGGDVMRELNGKKIQRQRAAGCGERDSAGNTHQPGHSARWQAETLS